jgi:hypothetical protein
MALNSLVIYLSFCFVIVVSEEMTQWYREGGDQGGISEMSGPDKDTKQREEYVCDDKTRGRTKRVTRKLRRLVGLRTVGERDTQRTSHTLHVATCLNRPIIYEPVSPVL